MVHICMTIQLTVDGDKSQTLNLINVKSGIATLIWVMLEPLYGIKLFLCMVGQQRSLYLPLGIPLLVRRSPSHM